jgi:hypothetical protein
MWQFLGGLAVTVLFVMAALPFRKRNKAPKTVTLLLFIAGCGLAGGVWGGIVDGFTSFIPQQALGIIVSGLALYFGIGLVLDLRDGKPDKQAQWIAFAMPLLFVLIPGAFGTQTQSLVENIDSGAKTVVSHANSGN